jgi:16S rRNA (adenine1518-N6/adenine1519-N6)-dimethyltransferase
MLTPGQVRSVLTAHGLAPSKSLGQNFVVDPNTVRKVVRDAGVTAGDLVVEIGPGLGSLTLALREAGATVVAVEVDAGLVRALGAVVGDDPDVRIVHADALTVNYRELVGATAAAMVANLPYNIATPILMTALRSGAFTRLLVMVQREVGERWIAQPGDTLHGGVSVKIAALASATIAARVSRNAFYPVPKVDSVTVLVEPRPRPATEDVDALFALVDAGFAQRRKRLRNTLTHLGHAPGDVEAALIAIGRPTGTRAEELDLPAWVALAGALGAAGVLPGAEGRA